MYKQEEVLIQGETTIAATITTPNQEQSAFPAIVLIGGTGGLNRDGNGTGFKSNLYKDLAEWLTTQGFVTLRFDKRGIGKSGGNRHSVGVTELVDDVATIIRYLKSLDRVSEDILLLGHSEGCIVVTLATEHESVSGMILLSGAGVTLKTSMQEQAHALLEEVGRTKGIKGKLLRLSLNEKSVIRKQHKLFERVTATDQDTMRIQLMKFPAKWLREHLAYTDESLRKRLVQLNLPTLAITGERDVQTDARHLDELDALHALNIETVRVADMDHMLKHFDGEMSILDVKKQYRSQHGEPLHPELQHQLHKWLMRHNWIL
ncbi:alpha/beta hydrolase [Exiguobacterium qingdaonense]|uniref:alpha/beta hydrolase n=1 Tax=Exiguobacterium qingdaonense TaxID=2751251 RepID=UPI001BE51EC7|nr:alpha/beta fold hydrolase [Exiguobacterium qingdaonense]